MLALKSYPPPSIEYQGCKPTVCTQRDYVPFDSPTFLQCATIYRLNFATVVATPALFCKVLSVKSAYRCSICCEWPTGRVSLHVVPDKVTASPGFETVCTSVFVAVPECA